MISKAIVKISFSMVILILPIILVSCATARTHFMDMVNLTYLKDGTYIGVHTTPLCSVKLETAIKNGRIIDIKILRHIYTYPLAGRAYTIIPKRIIEEQSLDVDAVTAATVSSNSIKRAVLKALEKAKQ